MAKLDQAEQLKAWEAFLLAHAAISARLNADLEQERELPLTWYDVLIQLQERGGSARMQDLARAVLFSKSGLTRLIDRMQKDGLVERRSCAEDGRGTLAVLTSEGKRRLARARPVHLRGIQEYFGRFITGDEARILTVAFQKMIAGLETERPEERSR